MARQIRIGVQLNPQHAAWDDLRRAAVEAEDAGVDAIFTWDHFFPLSGDRDGRHLECWTVLAAWAELTGRVELAPLVSCIGYRNPDLLADMARTVDHISGGRLVLGLGAGFKERDFVEYGYLYGTVGERLDALEAGLPRIEQRLGRLNPAPTRRIPVMVGGGGERRTLPLVARHADIWHTFAEGEDFARKAKVLDAACVTIGRDPGEIERSVLVGGDPLDSGVALRAQGVSLFVLGANGPGYDLDGVRRWVRWRDEENAVA
ncbi:LLM class F420-dependent oxidoreductase [Oryzihumus sp.]|uniref:LLM class F420-dependent oxidoreductase n=1 Tax=Oryzihumus sp. TaxID=1968903 RepID=UPI002ED9A151